MERKAATIYEVASLAGVSISTVSLALNNPARVRPATREKVFQAADQLGFVPKARAVIHARRGLGRIAAIAPFTSYPSYARRLAGVMDELGDSGTQLLVADVEDVAVADSPVLATLPIRGHVDGLINLGVPTPPQVGERLKERLPTVLLDVTYPGIPSICADFRAGGRMIAQHLLERGHGRIAYLREDEQFHSESPTLACLEGLRHAMGRERVREVSVPRGSEAGREGVRKLLDSGDSTRDVTAIVGSRDLVAIGALVELRRRGARVPEDYAVVGVDDDPVAEALDLTTLRYPYELSGQLAVRLLRSILQDPLSPIHPPSVDLELRVRSTSGGPEQL